MYGKMDLFKYNHIVRKYVSTYITITVKSRNRKHIDCKYLISITTNPSNVEKFLIFMGISILVLYQMNMMKYLEENITYIYYIYIKNTYVRSDQKKINMLSHRAALSSSDFS